MFRQDRFDWFGKLQKEIGTYNLGKFTHVWSYQSENLGRPLIAFLKASMNL
jgi:hypothetical protein